MAVRERQRVALAIGQLTYGGAETQLCELAEGLLARFDVSVYCLSAKSAPLQARLEAAGVSVEVLPARGSFGMGRVRALRHCLHRDRPAVLHAFLFIASAYSYLATRGTHGTRLVTSARNCKLEPSRVRRALIGRAFRASDAIICNSSEMAAFAGHHYRAPDARLRVVYNGVDSDRFVSRASRPQGPLRIGTVGRIERQKNLDLFLDCASKLLKTKPETQFEIVGSGSLREAYQAKLERLQLDESVRFVGPSDDVPGFLRTLDQFWLTSDWEGTPNVVLEAMAAGVAVVATRVGGTAEIIRDGVDGLLVEAGDRDGFFDAVMSLVENPSRADEIGQAATLQVAEKFSVPAMVATTVAVYDEFLEPHADQ